MKVGLFFLMQNPRPWDSQSDVRLYHEALEQIELADSLGFHHAWAVEHHFLEEYSHSTSPELFLAAAAMRTQQIRLAHGIVQLQPEINHPVRVAERLGVLDVLSKGRVDFGSGEGSGSVEIGAFGVDLETKKAAWEESLRATVRLMTQDPFEAVEGEHVSVPSRTINPKPLQKPHPPLWVAAPRPESIANAARLGLGALCFTLNVEPESAGRIVENYEAEIMSDGFVPLGEVVTPRVACVTPFMCHQDEQEALERGIDGAHFMGFAQSYFYHHGAEHPYGEANLWQRFEKERTEAGFDRAVASASIDALGARIQGENGAVIRGAIGTPQQIREFLRRYEAGGVDEVIFFCQVGKNKHEHIMEAIKLFGEEVLPEFIERDPATEAAREARLADAIAAGFARRAELQAPAEDEAGAGEKATV
jgi:alkanesulfonate monooxygenase SsuD/methylene tetrahydromethanopterin reductase-like flavin-dependent oxidoreductase (luciferase family)